MHVSRGTTLLKPVSRRFVAFLFLVFVSIGCGIQKSKYFIEDYVLVPNGKEIVGNDGLTAFVFENNKKSIPFQQFIAIKFKLQTLNEREIPFVLNSTNFILHVYDADETLKYINTFDFAMKNQIPDLSKMGNQEDFIVLSVTNDSNEDCLSDNSLYQNITIKYLQNLKEEYFNNVR